MAAQTTEKESEAEVKKSMYNKSAQIDEVEKDINVQCNIDYDSMNHLSSMIMENELMPQKGSDGGIGVQTVMQKTSKLNVDRSEKVKNVTELQARRKVIDVGGYMEENIEPVTATVSAGQQFNTGAPPSEV